jgi:hypothetical protein
MLIDYIYQTCKTLINTDGIGNFRPTDFNLALNNAINEKFEENLLEVNQLVNRENRGLINGGLENIPDRIRERIQHYLKVQPIVSTSGLYSSPPDCRYFDTITDANDISFEFCKNMEEFNIIKSVNASVKYPIFIKIGDKIKVAPSSITSDLNLYYLRNPSFSKWTYIVVGGNETFNPSASDFRDADIHPSERTDIVRRVCLSFGVNLKDEQIQNVMFQNEQVQNNQNNAS